MTVAYFVDVGPVSVQFRDKLYRLPYLWNRVNDIFLFRVTVDRACVSLYSSSPDVSAVITQNALQEGLDIRVSTTTGTGPGYIFYPEDELFCLYPGDKVFLWQPMILSLRDFSIALLRKCGLSVYSYAVDPRVVVYGPNSKIVASLGSLLDGNGAYWGAMVYKFKWDAGQFKRVFDTSKATQSCDHLVQIGVSYEDVWDSLGKYLTVSKEFFRDELITLFASRYALEFCKLNVNSRLDLV